MDGERIAHGMIAAAIEVHRQLGPGLLESVYQRRLAHEPGLRSIRYQIVNGL